VRPPPQNTSKTYEETVFFNMVHQSQYCDRTCRIPLHGRFQSVASTAEINLNGPSWCRKETTQNQSSHCHTMCYNGVKKALTRAPQAVVLTLHRKFKQMERKTLFRTLLHHHLTRLAKQTSFHIHKSIFPAIHKVPATAPKGFMNSTSPIYIGPERT